MRKSTPLILLLASTIFASSVFCCCAPEVVEAKPELPPCHQTAKHQGEQPAHECDCIQIQSSAVVASFDIAKPGIAQLDTIDIFNSLNSSISQQNELHLFSALSYEHSDSPPPLYLKHSNLRL